MMMLRASTSVGVSPATWIRVGESNVAVPLMTVTLFFLKRLPTPLVSRSETWRDRNSGERKEKTEWHTVVVFNEGLCKVVEQYVKKGAKLDSFAI